VPDRSALVTLIGEFSSKLVDIDLENQPLSVSFARQTHDRSPQYVENGKRDGCGRMERKTKSIHDVPTAFAKLKFESVPAP